MSNFLGEKIDWFERYQKLNPFPVSKSGPWSQTIQRPGPWAVMNFNHSRSSDWPLLQGVS